MDCPLAPVVAAMSGRPKGENAMKSMKLLLAMLMAVATMTLVEGCGGGGGMGSEATVEKSTIVIGTVAAPKNLGVALLAAGDPITVSVMSDPAITTTVGTDGTFTLRGLPAGSFTLLFMQGTTELGRLTFTEVAANQQITITVQVVSTEIVLVDEDRRGIGNAGVELEGPVQNVVVLNVAGDSRFVIRDRSVVARPGVTAIREGHTRKTVNDVTVGKQVHVKGTTVADSTDVLAFEIILQNATTGDAPATTQVTICHIPPGNPGHPVTITVSSSAWPAHQAHGDTEGACKP
jgi:hypothetical protein